VRHGRALSHSLLPVEPGEDSLHMALAKLAETTADIYKINCEFHFDDAIDDLATATATQLYRIVQEAVRDSIRHGRAKHVIIELRVHHDKLSISITDDAANVTEDGRFTEELMLRLMRHRAKVIGAKLKIKSWPEGLRVTCELPRAAQSMHTPR